MVENIQEIRLNRGLPGSGKSTFASEWLKEDPKNRVRVNRDEIRFQLFGTWYPVADENGTVKDKEQQVTEVEMNIVHAALRENKSLLVDNTNLNPRVFKTYGDIAKRYNVPLKNTDFPISVEEAIRRNNNRDRVVPEHVIRGMAKQYLGPNGEFHLFPGSYPVKPFIKPETMRHGIIFDMDGTLTDVRSIRSFVRGKYRNFDMFHRSSYFCPPNQEVLDMAFDADEQGYALVIVTARNETYREVTQAWLDRFNVPYDNIYMRADDDFRKDFDVKQDILAKINEDYDIVHAVDDNPAVRDVWLKNGIETTIVPGFHDEIDPIKDQETIHITNMLRTGGCLRCGKPLKSGESLGPRCKTKV